MIRQSKDIFRKFDNLKHLRVDEEYWSDREMEA